ncbi:MAG: carbohydrate ABC transporter permease [Alphaproteobacteria bacterium]|nr:carbohydrate ABC transporter permease [Alphaproteobacteria bacterium]
MIQGPIWQIVAKYIAILAAVAVALLPIVWMVTMAFKPVFEWNVATTDLQWLPKQPTLANFEFIFTGNYPGVNASIDRVASGPIFASLMCASLGTLFAVVVGTFAAYAVSRFKVMKSIGLTVLQLRLFPPLAVMVPLMVMWTYLDLIDTWFGLSLIYGIVTIPFSFWLMLTFFDEFPREIEEAALVEGCSHWRVFYRVVLPMVRAPLATTMLFVFILNWSDYGVALFLTNRDWVTIPVYMNSLSSAMTGHMYGAKAALGLIAALPPMILGMIIQRDLVRGLTFGALKR